MAEFLEKVPVKDIVNGERRLVFVDEDDTLDKALRILHEKNILAMPVRTVDSRGDEALGRREVKFSGVLSVLDVAAMVARDPESCGGNGEGVLVSQAMRKTAESWHMLLLDPHATVGRAMEYLGGKGFHRALVPNVCLSSHASDSIPVPSALVEEVLPHARGEAYSVLSQWDLLHWIVFHEVRFGLALAQSIESVGLEGGRVLGVTESTPLSQALDRMAGHAVSDLHLASSSPVSGLAVVDKVDGGAPWAAPDARVLDTLSASDLRGCSLSDLKDAHNTTVGAFLAQKRQGKPRKLFTCQRSSEIRTVLSEMQKNGVHRLWVTSPPDPEKPSEPPLLLGVVTLSDVIRIMRILPFKSQLEGGEEADQQFYDSFVWMEWDSI